MCASISRTSKIGGGSVVGENVVIEDDVVIGRDCNIGHGVIVYRGTEIGNGVFIESNCVIGRQPRAGANSANPSISQPPLKIGNNVIIGACVVLYAGSSIDDEVMIGDHTSVRERCTVCSKAIIGRGTTVECDAYIGARSKMQCACHITVGVVIEEDVFFGTEVCTMNDKYMDTVKGIELRAPIIKKGAAIGSNATLLPKITIGERAIVGAGSVVTRDVPAGETQVGVPARAIKRT